MEMDTYQTKQKNIISQEVLLAYPDFNILFEIHADASGTRLGVVISKRGIPVVFYSCKLNSAQRNYTTMEQELLAIIETLKDSKNILLGQRIMVYTNHKSLTYKNFNTARVIQWHMVLRDYAPELIYIPVTLMLLRIL
eukprot:7277349-Ditylum_brightwellii.AAC.1